MQKTSSLPQRLTQSCSLLLLASSLSLPFASDAASVGGTSAAQIPGRVVTVSPGKSLASVLRSATANIVFQLGAGTYTVTPSVLNSNLLAGNQFTGISFLNKTNITIQGLPGRTIIDGSTAPGELMWLSNCSGIKITGVTFKGYTNHNPYQLPNNGILWASVNLYKSERVEFVNCSWLGSADHGLQDKGAETGSSHPNSTTAMSTNGILVDSCYFYDIGGWRQLGGTIGIDGTAIVPTGWTIRNCVFESCLRGIEPYNENDATGAVFRNCSIQRNNFWNIADRSILTAGSTNGHEITISDNFIDEDATWSYHGTNLLTTGLSSTPGIAIDINGGRGHNINNNIVNRARYAAYILGGYVITDATMDGNKAFNVGNGVAGIGFLIGNENSTVAPVTRLMFNNNTARAIFTRGLVVLGARDAYFRNCLMENPTLFGISGNIVNASAPNLNTNLYFQNCSFTDRTGFQTYGMEIAAGSVNVNFSECIITGGSAGNYLNSAGDQTTISGPPKTFSTTVDLASIPASGQRIGNFSAPGVRTNDLVSLMLPNQIFGVGNFTNVSVTAWASNSTASDGVVFYNIKNLDTVSAADAPNVRLRATVRQVEAY